MSTVTVSAIELPGVSSAPPPTSGAPPGGAPPPGAQPFHRALEDELARTAPAEGQHRNKSSEGLGPRDGRHRHESSDSGSGEAAGTVVVAGVAVVAPVSRPPVQERGDGDQATAAEPAKVEPDSVSPPIAQAEPQLPASESPHTDRDDATTETDPAPTRQQQAGAASASAEVDASPADAITLPATTTKAPTSTSTKAPTSAKASTTSPTSTPDLTSTPDSTSTPTASPDGQAVQEPAPSPAPFQGSAPPPARQERAASTRPHVDTTTVETTAVPERTRPTQATDARHEPTANEVPSRTDASDPRTTTSSAQPSTASPQSQPVVQAIPQSGAQTVESGFTGDAPLVETGVGMQEMIESIHATIGLAIRQGVSQARIALQPAELGEIRVHLSQSADGLIARVTADTPAAAQALAGGRSELHHSLSTLGTSLLRLEIGSSANPEGRQQREAGSTGRRERTAGQQTNLDLDDPAGEPVRSAPAVTALGELVDVLA
jgi:flagellar hook-length control protein FliK